MSKKSNIFKKPVCIAVITLIAVNVVILPISNKVFDNFQTAQQLASAALCVVLSALATYMLLSAQSDADSRQERDSKVYEQKLAVFTEFLDLIHELLKDGKITPEGANKLKLSFAKVAIHLKSIKTCETICSKLQEIAGACNPGQEKGSRTALSREIGTSVVASTMEIVSIFRNEISDGTIQRWTDDEMMDTISKLSYLYDESTTGRDGDECGKGDPLPNPVLERLEKLATAGLDAATWKVSNADSFEVTYLKGDWKQNDNFCIRILQEKSKEKESPGRHYFQTHVHFPGGYFRMNLYSQMKKAFGGGYGLYAWWYYVDKESDAVLNATPPTAEGIEKAADACWRQLKQIVDYMELYLQRRSDIDRIAGQLGITDWQLGMFGNSVMLFCRKDHRFSLEVRCEAGGAFAGVKLMMRYDCPGWLVRKFSSVCKMPLKAGCSVQVCGPCADEHELIEKLQPLCTAVSATPWWYRFVMKKGN